MYHSTQQVGYFSTLLLLNIYSGCGWIFMQFVKIIFLQKGDIWFRDFAISVSTNTCMRDHCMWSGSFFMSCIPEEHQFTAYQRNRARLQVNLVSAQYLDKSLKIYFATLLFIFAKIANRTDDVSWTERNLPMICIVLH